MNLEPLLARIRLVVFDFDGVFTDNHVWVNERGEESVRCSRADGFGLRGCARSAWSGDPVHGAGADRGGRAQSSTFPAGTGSSNKLDALQEEAERRRRGAREDTAYVGNDINDAACLGGCRAVYCPADALPEVAGPRPLDTGAARRRGLVREFCDAVWLRLETSDGIPLFDLSGRVAVVTGGLGQLGSVYVEGLRDAA